MVLGYGVDSYAWWCFGMPLLGQQIPIFIDAEAFRQNPYLLLKSFLILVTFIGFDVTSVPIQSPDPNLINKLSY